MKSERIKIAVAAALLAFSAESQAQLPSSSPAPKKHSLNLSAQSVSSGGAARHLDDANGLPGNVAPQVLLSSNSQRPGLTSSTSSDLQTVLNGEHLEISVRNFSDAADTVKVEWYFFAFPVTDNQRPGPSKELIFDRGSQDITIPSGQVKNCVASSRKILSTVARSTSIVSSTNPSSTSITPYVGGTASAQSGMKLKGWCVRLLDNGQIVATAGSSQTYQDLAKDDGKLMAVPVSLDTPSPQGRSPFRPGMPGMPPGFSPQFPGGTGR